MTQKSIELVAWQGNGSIQTFQLQSSQAVLVGKSSHCGLQLSGHDISDIHCRIGFEGGHLWVQDWLSATGTRVNGELVTSKSQVGQGSVVEVGRYKIQISKAAMEAKDRVEEEQEFDATLSDATSSTLDSAALPPDQDVPVPSPMVDQGEVVPDACVNDTAEDGFVQSEATQSNVTQPSASPSDATQPNASPSEDGEDEPQPSSSMESDVDFFADEDDVYDRETVELLLAEIEDLRTSLAQRDSDQFSACETPAHTSAETDESESETVLHRIQELAEEANRADERVLILEEMLHAAEDVNRAEVEERAHLEAWVGDIEKRVGQREQEHAAELDALRERLDRADEQHNRLQRQMQQASTTGDSAQKRYAETMEGLQQDNKQLQDWLAETKKELRQLKQKYENQAEQSDVALREERAKIAKEHAEMSRLKFEYAQKIRDLEEAVPKSEPQEGDARLQNLREHRQYLREMSELKKQEQQTTLSGRLKRLWNSVE